MNDSDQPVNQLKPVRKPGQEIGNVPPSVVVVQPIGHKADAGAYKNSRKKVYIRKIENQKALKNKDFAPKK